MRNIHRELGVYPCLDTAWQDLVHPINTDIAFTPTMPLKKGHLAMLMASGMMGTLRLTSDDGYPMLVKGRGGQGGR